MTEETIVAIATPSGRGGVGIVRLSGPKALDISKILTQSKIIKPRYAHYVNFYHPENSLLDQGILLYFKAPHSFTGEEVVEFHAHGSPIVLDALVKACITQGARIAKAGEFSERAFLNDKMDLAQAEAVADLINASSMQAAKMALRSLQGDFSEKINALASQMIQLRVYVEAAIDFPEEEIDFLSDGVVERKLSDILDSLHHIREIAAQGAMLRDGVTVVIAGAPNAGKSTLINALAQKEVAIVTHIEGTTRDVMREMILLDDLPIHIVDTAGLRETTDVVEKEGIRRAYQEVNQADLILFMEDISHTNAEKNSEAILEQFPSHIPVIRIKNKIDVQQLLPKKDGNTLFISAETGAGLPLLKEHIKKTLGFHPAESQFLARRRHLEALDRAEALLLNGQAQLQLHRAGELLAEDLRQGHMILSEITGAYHSDDLLGEIFSNFCIGK